MLYAILAVALFQALVSGDANQRNFGHERVLENVLQNYGDAQFLVRPEQNTTAEVGLKITYIKSFNKGSGRLVAGYYLKQSWNDSRLSWEDRSVQSICLPSSRIWKPDWRLLNTMDYVEKIDSSVLPIVTPDGTVTWITPAEYTTQCKQTDDKKVWECNVEIGSWVLNANQLIINFMGGKPMLDLSNWESELYGYELEGLPSSIHTTYYDCCPDPYQHAHFWFNLRVIDGGVASGSMTLMTSSVIFVLSFVLCNIF